MQSEHYVLLTIPAMIFLWYINYQLNRASEWYRRERIKKRKEALAQNNPYE